MGCVHLAHLFGVQYTGVWPTDRLHLTDCNQFQTKPPGDKSRNSDGISPDGTSHVGYRNCQLLRWSKAPCYKHCRTRSVAINARIDPAVGPRTMAFFLCDTDRHRTSHVTTTSTLPICLSQNVDRLHFSLQWEIVISYNRPLRRVAY